MTILVGLEHRTLYRFDRLVGLGPHVIRLRPTPHCRTPIHSYSLRIEPTGHFVNWQQDPFGNHLARLVFPEKARELSITVDLVADLTVINPFDFFLDETADHFPFEYEHGLAADLVPYLVLAPGGALLDKWIEGIALPAGGAPTVDFLVALNRQVRGHVAYTTRLEEGVQAPEETLVKALGSCRDSAWLLVQILRRLGLAARFVSGYLVQLRRDERPLDGPAGPSADATDLHAWAEVYVPGAGWIGMDPTSGLFAGEGHIPLACTPEPSSAAAVTGVTDPCEVSFSFTNVVSRFRQDPRVTLPYSEEQWSGIDALGHRVDAALDAGDVRLTQCGSPTFVSIDDRESVQWSTAADGPGKRRLAWDLTQRLAARFGGGGIVHHGQGTWYPGEALPRRQHAILWRVDGAPLWRDASLLADPYLFGEGSPDDDDAHPAAGASDATTVDALTLAEALARSLDLPVDCVVAAYEDALHLLWTEAILPAGTSPRGDVDPTDHLLADRASRAELVRQLDAEFAAPAPAGFVIPLHRTPAGRWATTHWRSRRGRLVLLPGDSPLGLRLPLRSLTWAPALAPAPAPAPAGAGDDAPQTALCVQIRHGRIHVFLPPLGDLADACDLVTAVETAAGAVGMPVVLEGYPPPWNPRLRVLVVMLAPGVIEVNVQQSRSWDDLVAVTNAVHLDARACRLGTEKFELDGSHTGTGGGNYMTLGGATPADSPWLRRPDLLRSIVTYWQHHPSLSYLFSGKFIGPTGQAQRVDEGRPEALYELEIAFAEMDRLPIHPLLRHLLTDVTGNTRRAEFCIDNLFSPDTDAGLLGLVELRGFEMPPHPQMALVQALLVRALVARLWAEPYAGPLERWGTGLHDRFLLPHFVAADIAEVVTDLGVHGFAFDLAWLDPFIEFRFPRIGVVQIAGVDLELRGAIEPCIALREEGGSGDGARYADSSTERLQIKAAGLTGTRHLLTCNGRAVPLQPTAVPGTSVAGVRYRAWPSSPGLHPTIPAHSPLVFDLLDRWTGRSLGGCTYHVVHPGGRSYERFPVNANDAEARRASRFVIGGHTPGPMDADLWAPTSMGALLAEAAGTPEYPRTLDLRRAPRR